MRTRSVIRELPRTCIADFQSISICRNRRSSRRFSRAADLLPLPTTEEWGEDRGEGPSNLSRSRRLLSPALSSIRWRRGRVWLRRQPRCAVSQGFQPAGRPKFRTHPSYPTFCRLEIGDTAQRGQAATKLSLSSIGWRRGPGRGGALVSTDLDGPSPRSSPHSSVVERGRRSAAPENRRD